MNKAERKRIVPEAKRVEEASFRRSDKQREERERFVLSFFLSFSQPVSTQPPLFLFLFFLGLRFVVAACPASVLLLLQFLVFGNCGQRRF